MEQYSHSQYLLWMRSKHILNSHFQASMNSFSNSWEEQAFAEDAAGPLGGFVWPPRSYSCSFCKREFRSAQALGGHMNVHRRDRARLKQSLTTPSKNPHHHPSKSLDAPNPSHQQICTLESNPDPPNSNPNSTQDIHFDVSPPFTSSINNVKELIPFSSSTPSRSDNSKEFEFSVSDSRKEENTILGHDHDYVETSLSVGLNLVASQNQPIGSDIDEEAVCYKRHKKTSTSSSTFSSLPFFLKHPCSSDTYIYPYKSDVLGLRISTTSSMDEIDLELRLGDPHPPKVK